MKSFGGIKNLFKLHKYNHLFAPLKFKIQSGTYRSNTSNIIDEGAKVNSKYYDICLSRGDAILYHKEIFQPITTKKIAEVYKELQDKLKSNK